MWALRGIDLDLPKGHRIGIIGRNGAGKSTLLKLITGNLAPTEGEIEVTGTAGADVDAERSNRVLRHPQGPPDVERYDAHLEAGGAQHPGRSS